MRKFVLTAATAALALTLSTGGEFSGVSLNTSAYAQSGQQSANLSMPQLQSLVAPVALYPDSLLSQMLMASTYPLEVAEAANWQRSNAHLSGTQLQNALKPQTWDNSVKSLVSFPEALGMLGNKLDWTQKLGDAYLAQPKDLMAAVQALRAKAKQAGNLQTNQQIQVTTSPQSDIIIMPSNPEIIYVPTYNPMMVYGGWAYPAYPPYPAYNPAWGLMAFGAGMAVGAALWSTPHWGSGSITVNNNTFNNFNHNYNTAGNMAADHLGGSSNWNYNAAHRDGVPYSNSALSNRYGEGNRSEIDRNNIQRQQNAANDWKNNASPQDKQQAQQARENAQNSFNKNATSQEKQQASQMRSEGSSDWSQDKADPNKSREASQENQMRSQGRSDASQDRSSGGRSSGGSRGGFGGGHFGGGFRR